MVNIDNGFGAACAADDIFAPSRREPESIEKQACHFASNAPFPNQIPYENFSLFFAALTLAVVVGCGGGSSSAKIGLNVELNRRNAGSGSLGKECRRNVC